MILDILNGLKVRFRLRCMTEEYKNIEIVGKRVNKLKVNWDEINGFPKLAVELGPKNRFIKKGVYRFKSHQENDEWMMKVLTNQ